MPAKRKAQVEAVYCVACGCCQHVCPRQAVSVWRGVQAVVQEERCVGCGLCARECPAGTITMREVQS